MISFWIAFPSLIIGIILLIIPTLFLIQWICRILVWVCLGPWLRIYCELFVFQQDNPLDFDCDDSRNQHARQISQKITEHFKGVQRIARMKGEHAMKMKSMRMLRFGQHIAKVPSINVTRHYDFPLSQSSALHISAVPEHKNDKNSQVKILPSQRLEGHMIPMTEEQVQVFESSTRKIEKAAVGKKIPDKLNDNSDGEVEKIESMLSKAATQLGKFSFKTSAKSPIAADDPLCENHETHSDLVLNRIDIDDKVVHITAENLLQGVNDDKNLSSSHSIDYGSEFEEEGLEVIAIENESENDLDGLRNACSNVTESTLSAVYYSSDNVYAAFCRTASKLDCNK